MLQPKGMECSATEREWSVPTIGSGVFQPNGWSVQPLKGNGVFQPKGVECSATEREWSVPAKGSGVFSH